MREPEPPPIRGRQDPFAPLDRDDEGGFGGFGGYDDFDDGGGGDGGMLRVVGIVVALAALIAILVLPPVSILDRGSGTDAGGGGISTHARDDLPDLPAGLAARSQLYDIEVDESLTGPVTLTVRLSERAQEGDHLAFYTYQDGAWSRLVTVGAVDDGQRAQGELSTVPTNIAVLSRSSFARSLALMVDAGEVPDVGALSAAEIVSVAAASPALGDDGTTPYVALDSGGLDAARTGSGDAAVYLGVTADEGAAANAVDVALGTPELIDAHVSQLIEVATEAGAAGLHIDYRAIDPARRNEFTDFVRSLRAATEDAGLGLVVSVPTPVGADFGAYDWSGLSESADALWLVAPADRSVFYDQIEAALAAQREAGTDLSRVALMIDRRSYERTADGVQPISLQDALALASTLRGRVDAGIAPGDAVSISGANIDRDAGNTGLRWDDRSRTVSFAYAGRGGPRTVWVENRFSAAFRLDLADRYGLGGVVVAAAAPDGQLPDLWETVARFVEEGYVELELPYGGYLLPQWTAADGLIEGSGETGTIVWRAPEREGTYDVTLIVSDGVVFVGQQIVLRVANPAPEAPAAGSEDSTGDSTATDDTATDSTTTDDGTTDGTATDDGTSTDSTADSGTTADDGTGDTTTADDGSNAEPTPTAEGDSATPPGPAGNTSQ